MKKQNKIFALAMATLMVGSSLAACGGTQVQDDDKRQSVFINVFNGGYGREWLDDIVADYNAANRSDKYKVVVRSAKDEFNTILTALQSDTAPYDMFYSNSNIYKMIDGKLLEPITDVWDSKPDGSDRTIRQMMIGAEDYAKGYADSKGAIYALPLQESVRSFAYDHDLFLQYGLLFNEQGAFISSPTETLSKGKDGVAGTYDDGHPITEAQWDLMVKKATQLLGYAIGYTGKFISYFNDFFYAISAQYDGVDKFMIQYTLDGTYDFDGDGTEETTIDLDNGYRYAEFRGQAKAAQWMDTYLATKDATLGIVNPYVNPKSSGLSYSHTDAQTDFIVDTAKNKAKKTAMLAEGDWWENESKPIFDDLAAAKYDNYKYRTHNFKFMTMPLFEGQKEKGSVYAIAENQYLALKKQSDPEKAAFCKDFMTYAYQPKYIQNFTVKSGGVMPYDVDLTPEQEAGLSPFVKSFRELYYDRVNNKFVNAQLYDNMYLTTRSGLTFGAGNSEGWTTLSVLYTMNAEQFTADRIASIANNWANQKAKYLDYAAKWESVQ